MGASVLLDIVPERIEAAAWAAAFDDTKRLLSSHPSRLMGLGWADPFGVRLAVYMRTIEREAHDPSRISWCVLGDRASLRRGECQLMHRDLGRYRRAACDAAAVPDDILLYAAAAFRRDAGGPVRVFGGSTSGAPYHAPVVAAAMVIESLFPRAAMVFGSIDRALCEAAKASAEVFLQREVSLPVRVDAPRLVARLREHLPFDTAAKAFALLYSGEFEGRVEALVHTFPKSAAEEWLMSELRVQSLPSDPSPRRVIIGYLNATEDVARLCEMACLDARGPRYPPELFVAALADSWIVLPRERSAFLDAFQRAPGSIPPADGGVGSLLLDLGAVGRNLRVRFEVGAVELAFSRVFGEAAPRLVALLRQHTDEIEQALAASRDDVVRMASRLRDEASDPVEDLAVLPSVSDLSPRRLEELRAVAFVVRRSREHMTRTDPERAAAFYGDAASTRAAIARVTARRGPTLTEDAWDAIAAEDDLDVLHFLLAVATLPDETRSFGHLRRALFENAALRRYVASLRL